MKTKLVVPGAAQIAFREDIITIFGKYGNLLTAEEMLALASHLVGQLIAMQDQRTTTREMALELVIKNIEKGNEEVLSLLVSGVIGGKQ